jgi:hypothetical protein
MDRDKRKQIPIVGLGVLIGGLMLYQLLRPKKEEEKKEEVSPEELRRECRARIFTICSQTGGTLKDKCSENEVSIASYECVDTIYQCCISTEGGVGERERIIGKTEEAIGVRERIIGVATTGAAATTTTTQEAYQPPPAQPQPKPYQPPPEIPIEVLQPGCPPSLPDGPYDKPLPEVVEETINTINPFGRKIRATIVKKCYCYPLGPTEKPYYCCSCPQILCPSGYYPSDVSSGDERSFLVYPGLWCNPG